MKNRKSNLDERQEQALLQIERRGCWLAFWGLLAAMVVQVVVYGFDYGHMAGEWIVFMALALYLWGACLKNGIWDRRLKPNAATNLVISLTAGLAVGGLMFLRVFHNYPDSPFGAAAAGIITAACVFAACFLALLLSANSYRRRVQSLEAEPEEDDPRGQT